MLCIGHRGAMGHEPENTLLSIEKAISLGASWVEIDVQFADGHLVVIHDYRLERTTNGTGYIHESTFEYLRSLNAGKGQKIPTLEEVFATINGKAGLNIELKGSQTTEPVTSSIREQIEQGWDYKDILVSSFNHFDLLSLKRLDANVLTGALIEDIPADKAAFVERLGCYSIHLPIGLIDKSLVDDACRLGLKVFVFTVNEPEDIERMELLGVDGVFTDYPERVVKYNRLSSPP
ncbi:MAG: glycerophosphodiester phosphodiesterase family protein [Pseudomonadota bacterium]